MFDAPADSGLVPGEDEILFVGLGGLGEIGMNLTMYGYDGRWLIVDCGVTFGDDTTPGIDVMMPDVAFAEANRDRLAGLVVTHAHEDHVGAVAYLWDRLRCPVYATPFTAAFLRRKLQEDANGIDVPLRVVDLDSRFDVGPFGVELVTMTHSIPEPSLLVLETGIGRLVHSGDWKLDRDPRVHGPVDAARLRRIGEAGVMALVCDSTNAMTEGRTGSEGSLIGSIREVIAERRHRVVFTCFASNIARMRTIAEAAAAEGRDVALVGRSLRRMDEIGRQTGYLDGIDEFVSEKHIGYLPRGKTVMICTGSQGEPRAALARIAAGSHPSVELEPGDTVVFSSRDIPGNERAILRLQAQLMASGIEIVTADDAHVHVSGHPARDELRDLYDWLRPGILVPMHGEYQHLHANAALGRELGIPVTAVAMNGTILRLKPGAARAVGEVPTGRLAVDGTRLVPAFGAMVRQRRRLLQQGVVMVSLVADGLRLHGEPAITLEGLVEGEDSALDRRLVEGVARTARDLLRDDADDEDLQKGVGRTVRRILRDTLGKRPQVTVHVIRLE